MRIGSSSIGSAFDWLYSEKRRKTLERWVVRASIVGFLAHLTQIFLARNLANPPLVIAAGGTNYLSAISTPFNLILFYEVLSLISAIPESTTTSIAMQFQVVSLIFMRNFFKHIATLDLGNLNAPARDLAPALLDVSAGLFMFVLVTVFRHAVLMQSNEAQRVESSAPILRLVHQKKMLALGMTVVFFSLAAVSVWDYALETNREMGRGGGLALSLPISFYSDVFTAMIFSDVLLLILSLLVSDRYEQVFRNAAFVISTVLIRLSLTVIPPYGALLGVVGMLFGIATILIYNYSTRIMTRQAKLRRPVACDD